MASKPCWVRLLGWPKAMRSAARTENCWRLQACGSCMISAPDPADRRERGDATISAVLAGARDAATLSEASGREMAGFSVRGISQGVPRGSMARHFLQRRAMDPRPPAAPIRVNPSKSWLIPEPVLQAHFPGPETLLRSLPNPMPSSPKRALPAHCALMNLGDEFFHRPVSEGTILLSVRHDWMRLPVLLQRELFHHC